MLGGYFIEEVVVKWMGITVVFLSSVCAVGTAHAGRVECSRSLTRLMDSVESDVRTMPKVDANVHKYCVMWLYKRGQYEVAKSQNGGEELCPNSSADWRTILGNLMTAHSAAKSICGDKKVCTKGCGKALSVIRSGGSLQLALQAIPKDE